jgi:hypothetical protein
VLGVLAPLNCNCIYFHVDLPLILCDHYVTKAEKYTSQDAVLFC